MSTAPAVGSDPAADSRRGSGTGEGTASTLGDVMRGPSITPPDVVVLDSLPETPVRKDVLDPNEDLWLSTADG
jgi:hypothetical protein